MSENAHYLVDKIFTLGPLSDDLTIFTYALLDHWLSNDILGLRTEETRLAMATYSSQVGGSKGMGEDISSIMGVESIAFIANLFPYDAIVPESAKLIHTCLFSKIGEIDDDLITHHIKHNFGNKPALIFVNEQNRKSVKDIWHAHVVIDLA